MRNKLMIGPTTKQTLMSGRKHTHKSDAAVIISINTSQSQTSFYGGDKGVPMTGKSMHNRKFTESSTNFNSGGDNHGGSIIR